MTANTIRKKVITYVADMDEKKLKEVYSIFENEIENLKKISLSKEHIDILNEEREKHILGEGNSYTWSEAKNIIKGK